MIRNCKVGQRVRITKNIGRTMSWCDGKLVASFDSDLCNTGTVVGYRGTHTKYLVVKVDAPNFGELWLRPGEVEKTDETQ